MAGSVTRRLEPLAAEVLRALLTECRRQSITTQYVGWVGLWLAIRSCSPAWRASRLSLIRASCNEPEATIRTDVVKAHEAIAHALAELGSGTIFGVLGEGNIHIVDDLVVRHGLDYVKATREDAAVLMAMGYALVGDRLGVATVSHGPALANSITALTQAALARVPMVVFAGDTDPSIHLGRQNIDQRALIAPTGAAFRDIGGPNVATVEVARAVQQAWTERRPVVLNARVDVQAADADHQQPAPSIRQQSQALRADPEVLDQAVGVIAASRRPVVIAGRGAVVSGARTALVDLAARIGAPLATTLLAREYFDGEDFNLGICGSVGSALANRIISEADCLVVFGASLNAHTTAEGSLTRGKAVVHVDHEAARLGERSPVTVGVKGDAARVAVEIVEWLDELEWPGVTSWCSPELRTALQQYSPLEQLGRFETKLVDGRRFTIELDGLLPRERTVVCDSGAFMLGPLAWLGVPEPQAFVQTTDFGSIGLGLATGIGAGFARPDRPIVVATGDGGLSMSLPELLTAVRYELDLICVVFNNSAYGVELLAAERHGLEPEHSLLWSTDFASIAEGMGAAGVTVADAAALEVARLAIASDRRPLLIDVKTDPRGPTGP